MYRSTVVAQGSSAFARVGGKARLVGVVGLGPVDKAKIAPTWGASPFQVCYACGQMHPGI